MWSPCITIALTTTLLMVPSVSGIFPFKNRNGDSGADGVGSGFAGGGKRNNPRLPVSPEAYMSSVSKITNKKKGILIKM